jgi:hypothetical protein
MGGEACGRYADSARTNLFQTMSEKIFSQKTPADVPKTYEQNIHEEKAT